MGQAPSSSRQRVVWLSLETLYGCGKVENDQLIVVVGHVAVGELTGGSPVHKAA